MQESRFSGLRNRPKNDIFSHDGITLAALAGWTEWSARFSSGHALLAFFKSLRTFPVSKKISRNDAKCDKEKKASVKFRHYPNR
jgi:hypothetical protein